MFQLRQVGARMRLLRSLCGAYRSHIRPVNVSIASSPHRTAVRYVSVRPLHTQSAEEDLVQLSAATSTAPESSNPFTTEETEVALIHRVKETESSYSIALRAFNELRRRGKKLSSSFYQSLLYKASREGRYQVVWDVYKAFQQDEQQGQVQSRRRALTTWPKLSYSRMQMRRFVMWALLDAKGDTVTMTSFYQQEVVGRPNVLGIHEADPLNFLLHVECTGRTDCEQEQGLRHRVETLLATLEHIQYRTSYSAVHTLFRLILHRPDVFFNESTDGGVDEGSGQLDAEGMGTNDDKKYDGKVGELIIEYMDRFPCAVALDPKRLSIAVSAAAAAGRHAAARLLLEHGVKHRVPIDAGSFAHVVESAPDEASRVKVADLYMYAKERELVYVTHDTESSIINYFLLYAIFDGSFKHMMELLHEMELYNNKISNRTVWALFRSIAKYRANTRHLSSGEADTNRKLSGCPTISELFEKFPNVIPRTVHSFSTGITQCLFAGDLSVALGIMRAALWTDNVKLRPEIYSQLLYPLLAGGQRGGDQASDASMFDRLEVERSFDRQYPGQRTHLNALVLNICEANDDLSTMLVCLDRWQGQRHLPMSRRTTQRAFDVLSKQMQRLKEEGEELTVSTAFVIDGMELSYLAFLQRYQGIIKWDAWTISTAIIRAGTHGFPADVVALLAEADARDLVLKGAAYKASLGVLEAVGEPSAVVAYAQKLKSMDVWEKTVTKYPVIEEIVTRATAGLEVEAPSDEEL